MGAAESLAALPISATKLGRLPDRIGAASSARSNPHPLKGVHAIIPPAESKDLFRTKRVRAKVRVRVRAKAKAKVRVRVNVRTGDGFQNGRKDCLLTRFASSAPWPSTPSPSLHGSISLAQSQV